MKSVLRPLPCEQHGSDFNSAKNVRFLLQYGSGIRLPIGVPWLNAKKIYF